MKIAVLTEYYPDPADPASGVYVHIRAAAYREAGHDVRVFRVLGAQRVAREYGGVPVLSAGFEETRAECADFGPDVIALHTPHPGAPHTRLAEAMPAPRVVWIHGYEAMVTAFHGYHRGFRRVLSLMHDTRKLWHLRRSLAAAAAVVYVSRWMRSTAERSMRFHHPRTAIIPNPVDVDRFRPATRASQDGRFRGLALRGLRSKYGLDLAVEAYSGIRSTQLTIVGTGPDAQRLRRQIERSGSPVVLEERAVPHSEVPALMNEFDYFVAPARTEAQGVAMCEAMSCELPVVATRAGGIPEFVRDGEDGILVSPGSPTEFRRAVLDLVSEPERAKAMGRSARKRVIGTCAATDVSERELTTLAEAAG
jgi:glycosyltransferase involved in cell wall biosynthesis